MTTSGSLVKSYSFSLQDLKLGDDNSWISTSYVELSAGMLYNISLTYESSSLNYGIPWPLLLDSFILMLDYNWASYFTTMSNVRIKNEIITCYTNSRALATTYNLPSQCGPHTFTIDLQLYSKALACNCFQPGSFSWTTCAEFGGQCHCKVGYGGRRCDQCIPGYYGNPTSGCLRKIFLNSLISCNHNTTDLLAIHLLLMSIASPCNHLKNVWMYCEDNNKFFF